MSSALTTFVLNALWQTTLVAAAGLALERLCAQPRWRFAVAAGAFALACLVPLSAWTGAGGGRAGAGAGAAPGLVIDAKIAKSIAIAEMLLIAVAAIRLARRWLRARRLLGGDVAMPMVVGIVKPVIVLPAYLRDDDHLRNAALAHERAHIARRDPLIDFGLELLALPLAWHPALLLLRRRIHELREMCCDERAAAEVPEYARALVAIARLAAPAPAMAMAEATSIERRIAALRGGPRRGVPFVAAAVVIAIAAACSRQPLRPHVGADLSGTWVLDRAASNVRYRSFTQTIRQNGTHLAVTQQRDARRIAWQVDADGVKRPFPGVAKSTSVAVWVDDKLVVDLRAPHHSERGMVWLAGNDAMVAVGETVDRGRRASYHAVFRRQR